MRWMKHRCCRTWCQPCSAWHFIHWRMPQPKVEMPLERAKTGLILLRTSRLRSTNLTYKWVREVVCSVERKRHYGEALALKYILGQLLVDLRARLRVFSAHKDSLQRSSVLQSSQLWRLLTVCIHFPCHRLLKLHSLGRLHHMQQCSACSDAVVHLSCRAFSAL